MDATLIIDAGWPGYIAAGALAVAALGLLVMGIAAVLGASRI